MASPKKKSPQSIYVISGIIAFVFLLAGAGLLYLLNTADKERKERQVASVSLLKPPPPPQAVVKERPPEPEIKKENVIEAVREQVREEETKSESQDNKPAGQELGLDAVGSAGSDGFGLVGKKGGRDITTLGKDAGADGTGHGTGGAQMVGNKAAKIGNGLDQMALLRKYSSYTQFVQEEIRKTLRKRLDEENGIAKGRYEAVVRIVMNRTGAILDSSIIGSSGNRRLDEVLMETIGITRISETPPSGMPLDMNIKITSQG
jgi:TonB family protein